MSSSSPPDAPASPESDSAEPVPGLWRRIFGRLDWQPPDWVPVAAARVRAEPRKYLGGLAALLLIGTFGYWLATRPAPVRPDAVKVTVQAPALTDYAAKPKMVVHPLRISFSRSAAPIKGVGNAPHGLVMEPEVAGAWEWSGDRSLVFTPANDWPVGADYKITFDPKTTVAPGVYLEETEFEFSTAPFSARLGSSEFYQDPLDPTLKKGVYQLAFSHPVDAASLEGKIKLTLKDGAAKSLADPSHTLSYDERRLKAWVHSQALQLPENGGLLKMDVAPGIVSSLGGKGSQVAISGQVALPSLYSVTIDSATSTLVDNERFEPEQVLVLEFNNAMKDSDVAGATRVWLLPEKNPKLKPDQQRGIYRWGESEVDESILKLSEPVSTTAMPTEREYIEAHSLKYRAPPGRFIYVRVARGLKSFGGFILGAPFAAVREVPEYPQLLRFLGDGALLSLQGERRISIVSRNLPRARLEIGRVLPEQLQHLAFNNYGSYARPELGGVGADSLVERVEQRLTLPADDPAKAHYEGVDLGKFLAAGRRGIFMLSLRTMSEYDATQTAQQTLARNAGEEKDSRLVVLTDLGIIVKKALDGSRDVFVQSLTAGTPVAGAQVKVIARNGEMLVDASTDEEGRARLPNLDGFQREKQPVMLTVGKAEDFSFLPMGDGGRTLDYSRFDIGGEPSQVETGTLKAFLFSDRGLYRPGDRINLGIIVRAADWKRPLKGLPLELVLSDPRGTVARRERITLSESGFESFNYTSQDAAASGTWDASLFLIGRNDTRTMIGQTTVQVREFAPDTMRVRATLSVQNAQGWVKPEALSVTVAAENLFGTPAQKRKVEGTMVLRPAFPNFPAYPDYRFYDPMLAKEGYDEQLSDQSTDDKGNAVFKLDLSKYAKATYQLNFLARAFEPGSGRNVAAQASTLVSSNDFLVGIKAVDGLDFVKRKDKRSVQLLAIGPDGKPRAVNGLHAVIVEKRFVSVLTKQDSGLFRYVSHERRYPLKDTAINLGAAAQSFALPTDQPGNFVLEMRAADGTVLNQVAFSVAGAANLSRSLERNAELTLSLSKPRYKPGDTIEVSVRAPYAGSGLITIERDRVYAQAWFRADTTSSVQKIRVPADFEGNGYVNVQFLRDPSSDEIFMSPLTFGVAPFAVDRTARTQPLSIKLPAVVRPGALIPVDIKTEGKARVVVFAVDEGILQVARYRVGDPLDFFFTKKMLQVDTAQILDLLLPEFSRLAAMAAPGGDGSGDLAKNLNPFKRRSEKPAVWWSGIIDVDGSKKVNFRLPDHFNGRIRVTAVAVTADRLGITETQATVRGDFVLTPTVPTHVAPGDEFDLPVGIANTIEGARTPSLVNATLELPPSLTLVGTAPAALSIAPGSEGTVRFRVRAGSALGAVAVVVRAKSGAYSAQRRIEVSLRPGIVARQDLRAGRAEQRVILEKLRVMYNPLSTRQLAASSSPLVAIDGLTAYLHDYPHLCTEQLLSQAMPALVYSSRPELGHKVDRSTGDRGNLIDVLRSRQNSEGGLGSWTATPDADPFVTAYAALYLLESRERGIAVPEDMLVSLNGYLETLAADASRNDLPFLRQRAMAVYLLVRQGRTASNLLSAVQEQLKRDQPKAWQDDAAGMLVAASYQLLQQDKAARPLAVKGLGRVNTASAPTPVSDYHYYYDGGIELAWTLYLLNRHFPALARQVKPVALDKLMAPLRENSYNTLSSALTVLALDAQAGALGNPPPPTLQAAGKEGPGRQIGKVRGVVTFGNFTAADSRLWVTPASAEPVWYVLNQSGYDRQAPATTQNHGLEVIRDYLDNQGKPITTLALGQEVTVRLRVRALGAKAHGQIAIVDLLPGGFEAVLQSPPVAAEPSAGSADEENYVEDHEGDDEGEQQAYAPSVLPLALPGSNYVPDHIELREDRVVFYGSALEDVAEFKYKLRANNAGLFVVPPIYAESMYQRSVYAQGGPAGSLRVNAPSP